MKKDNLILFGRIIKPHGVKGEIRIDLKSSTWNEELESVFIEIDGKQVPFFVTEFLNEGPFAILNLEGIDSFEQAANLKGCSCYFHSDKKKESETSQELAELISCEVEDLTAGPLGKVTAIEEGAQDRLVVAMGDKEIMIPFAGDLIQKVDIQSKKILVDLPEGFLDIYQ